MDAVQCLRAEQATRPTAPHHMWCIPRQAALGTEGCKRLQAAHRLSDAQQNTAKCTAAQRCHSLKTAAQLHRRHLVPAAIYQGQQKQVDHTQGRSVDDWASQPTCKNSIQRSSMTTSMVSISSSASFLSKNSGLHSGQAAGVRRWQGVTALSALSM